MNGLMLTPDQINELRRDQAGGIQSLMKDHYKGSSAKLNVEELKELE